MHFATCVDVNSWRGQERSKSVILGFECSRTNGELLRKIGSFGLASHLPAEGQLTRPRQQRSERCQGDCGAKLLKPRAVGTDIISSLIKLL